MAKRKDKVYKDGSTCKDGIWNKTWYIVYVPDEGFSTRNGYTGHPFSMAHPFKNYKAAKNSSLGRRDNAIIIPVTLSFDMVEMLSMAWLTKGNQDAFDEWFLTHQREIRDAQIKEKENASSKEV